MTADEIVAWLEVSPLSQRDKLAHVWRHVPTIRAYFDAEHARVIREVKRRLNSRKLVAELATLLVELTRDRAPNPREQLAPADDKPATSAAYASLREELEAAIAVDPEVQAAYLPYGDYLESIGDPFGPLVAMDRELVKNPGHKAMKVAREGYFREHERALMGALVDCRDMIHDVRWHMGFIKSIQVLRTYKRVRELPDLPFSELLPWLLDEPGPGRFLQRLHLLNEPTRMRPAARAIAAKPRPTLRELEIEIGEDVDYLDRMMEALPNLRSLHVTSNFLPPNAIAAAARAAPGLTELSFTHGDITRDQVRAIGEARWPSLEVLRLESNNIDIVETSVPEDIAPLFDGRAPKLRRLTLAGFSGGDDLCALLAGSPLFAQLESLDLTRGTAGERGAIALLAFPEHLAKLELTAEENYIPTAFCAQLRAAARVANLHGQRDDNGNPAARYVQAYE